STLRRKYMLYDTVSVASGWGFKVNRRLSEGASIQFLPDTIVNGKKYLHGIFTRTTGGIEYNFDGWFLTSPKKTLFSLDQTSYRSTGVPMVGYHQYPLGKRGLKAVMDVSFITDTLTAEEERIFAAWEQYAREHPVR
ncbi:MAG: hypothetical protein JNM88_20305, partial [Chitinophagaceae bacterium]|nr:hypothetical protein [Chitinophagaceae bacterium]